MFSCAKKDTSLKKTLRAYVEKGANGYDLKYKLIAYQLKDTLTVGQFLDSTRSQICQVFGSELKKGSLEDFKKSRNQEFKEFRSDPTYEKEVMYGSLKDASPWCTEIREITERADSLIANWDNIDEFSYDYHYLTFWYLNRRVNYYSLDYDLVYEVKQGFEVVKQMEKTFEEYHRLKDLPRDSIVNISCSHTYSIYNPLFQKRVNIRNNVYLDKDLNYKGHETDMSFGDMMQQIAE